MFFPTFHQISHKKDDSMYVTQTVFFFLFVVEVFHNRLPHCPRCVSTFLHLIRLLKWKHENRLLGFTNANAACGCCMLWLTWQTLKKPLMSNFYCAVSLLPPSSVFLALHNWPQSAYSPCFYVLLLTDCGHVGAQHTLSDANLEDLHSQ